MTNGKPGSPWRLAVPVVLLVLGIAVIIWTRARANEYYHASELSHGRASPGLLFSATRTGRYELHCDDGLGDLTFGIVNHQTATSVLVQEFGFLTEVFHAQGQRGYSFQIDQPGLYRLTANRWPAGAKVLVISRDTRAIALWTLSGIVAGGLLLAAALLLLLASLRGRRQVPIATVEDTGLTSGR